MNVKANLLAVVGNKVLIHLNFQKYLYNLLTEIYYGVKFKIHTYMNQT